MIEVTENDNGTFTISWDENDPLESVFNDWSEKDWIKMLKDAADEILSKKEYSSKNFKVTGGESQDSNITEATEEDWEDFWNSESEGRDKDYIKAVNQETFGQVYHSPEAQGSWH